MPTTQKPDWQVAREKKFPADVVAAAQRANRTYGVPACVILAQWALESAWGKKVSGTFNYFGEKWHEGMPFTGKACTTHEFINGKWILVRDTDPGAQKFINFPDASTAFEWHARHLATSQYYRDAQKLTGDWLKYLNAMGAVYATDPGYRASLLTLIRDYHLQDWNVSR